MIPDIELQLQAVVKSLSDNVLPALDKGNQLAAQQGALSVATLKNILQHLPLLHATLRRDIETQCALAEQVLASLDTDASGTELESALAIARSCLTDPTLGIVELQRDARNLREALGAVIATHSDAAKTDKLMAMVLASSEQSLMLGRSYNKPMGFEPSAKDVPDLATLLAEP